MFLSLQKQAAATLASLKNQLEKQYFDIESRSDLNREQKLDRLIHTSAALCATVAVQPIPFADVFILTPLQALMGTRIAKVYGLALTEQEGKKILEQLASTVGMGLLAQQLGMGAAKLLFPLVGGIATAPVVYGLTYGIGHVMSRYFEAQSKGQRMSEAALQALFQQAKAQGQQASEAAAKSGRGA